MNENLTGSDQKTDLPQPQDAKTEADPKNEQLLEIGKRLTESLKTLSGKEPDERYVAARQLVDVMMESLRVSGLEITPEVIGGLQVATDQMSYEMFRQRVEKFLTAPLNLTTSKPEEKLTVKPDLLTPISPLNSARVNWQTPGGETPTGSLLPKNYKTFQFNRTDLLKALEEIQPLETLPRWRLFNSNPGSPSPVSPSTPKK